MMDTNAHNTHKLWSQIEIIIIISDKNYAYLGIGK